MNPYQVSGRVEVVLSRTPSFLSTEDDDEVLEESIVWAAKGSGSLPGEDARRPLSRAAQIAIFVYCAVLIAAALVVWIGDGR